MLKKFSLVFIFTVLILFSHVFVRPVFADDLILLFNYAGGEAPGYPGAIDCNTPLWTSSCGRWGTTTGATCCTSLSVGADYCSSSYSSLSNLTSLSCWSYPPPTPTP